MNELVQALPTQEQRHAYFLLRILAGLNFFGHGFARIFTGKHLSGFADGMVKSMAAAPLSPALVHICGYVIPVVELIIGVLLMLGVATRFALSLALLLMMVLTFGVTMKQDWDSASTQLIYGAILSALLFLRARYDVSWLGIFRRQPYFSTV